MDSLWHGLLDFLLPRRCLWCGTVVPSGRRSVPICSSHEESLESVPGEACRYCARPMVQSEGSGSFPTFPRRPICGSCRKRQLELEFVAAGFQFRTILREVVSDWKFGSNPEWGPWLASRLAPVVERAFNPSIWDVLVPVPLYHGRLEDRGFNQARQLAAGLSASWGLPHRTLLKKHRRTDPQSSLGRSGRMENLKNAFSTPAAGEAIRVDSVLIVDDIYTTGSTLRTAAKVLKRAGVKSVGGVVLARTLPEER